ncbi:MAG: hypothetical protein K6G10_01495 [Butyrivibrio sp.]|nr:hypothetical protein [Butyrivibrio sp.]
MSHSRIYQISRSPISKDDYIDESRYYDCFVGEIADYVSEDTDRDEDIKTLKASLGDAAVIEGDKLTITNKQSFFKRNYRNWIAMLNKLKDISLEEFCEPDKDLNIFRLNCLYNDRHDIYMDDNDEECGNQTLSDFLRDADDGDVFYLGATIDYHF